MDPWWVYFLEIIGTGGVTAFGLGFFFNKKLEKFKVEHYYNFNRRNEAVSEITSKMNGVIMDIADLTSLFQEQGENDNTKSLKTQIISKEKEFRKACYDNERFLNPEEFNILKKIMNLIRKIYKASEDRWLLLLGDTTHVLKRDIIMEEYKNVDKYIEEIEDLRRKFTDMVRTSTK